MIRHEDSVPPDLLRLLRILAATPELGGFCLGGGTSLALTFGHRKSVDIDLFNDAPFESARCLEGIRRVLAGVEVVNRTSGSVCVLAEGIKVDVLHHPYPWLEEASEDQGIRFVSRPDMAAMKVNAVTNGGSKKDFSDLLLLHEQGILLTQSLAYFCEKYGDAGRFLAIRSLAWFEDADAEPDPIYLNGWRWETVRDRMSALAKSLIG